MAARPALRRLLVLTGVCVVLAVVLSPWQAAVESHRRATADRIAALVRLPPGAVEDTVSCPGDRWVTCGFVDGRVDAVADEIRRELTLSSQLRAVTSCRSQRLRDGDMARSCEVRVTAGRHDVVVYVESAVNVTRREPQVAAGSRVLVATS
ncbi:MAG: hypothetical protein M3467_06995 [Actinomycetota bacterium]|nr:hypothetical protein [Actinomycetota bacterium]